MLCLSAERERNDYNNGKDWNHETLPEIVCRSAFKNFNRIDEYREKELNNEEQLILLLVATEQLQVGTEQIYKYFNLKKSQEPEVFLSKHHYDLFNQQTDYQYFQTIRSVVYAHCTDLGNPKNSEERMHAEFWRYHYLREGGQHMAFGNPELIEGNSFLYLIRKYSIDKSEFEINFQIREEEVFAYFNQLLARFDIFTEKVRGME